MQAGLKLIEIPFYLSKVSAGFPSPGEDFIEDKIDLNKLLIKKNASTYFVKVVSKNMIEAGIFPGDLLIVDRSLEAVHGNIVLVEINGELSVKKLHKKQDVIRLFSANDTRKPLEVTGELSIWGVVCHSIRSFEHT